MSGRLVALAVAVGLATVVGIAAADVSSRASGTSGPVCTVLVDDGHRRPDLRARC